MQYDISKSLTEKTLGEKLKTIFNKDFVHNRYFLIKRRPDYRNDELKLIVEYDGPYHYLTANRIIEDNERDKFYLSNGYKTIRIPMFVQLHTDSIKDIFGVDCEVGKEYPSGFISDLKTMKLPCDFCELGIKKFKDDLERIPSIKDEVIQSLKVKIEKLGNINKVLPPSLHYLVK